MLTLDTTSRGGLVVVITWPENHSCIAGNLSLPLYESWFSLIVLCIARSRRIESCRCFASACGHPRTRN